MSTDQHFLRRTGTAIVTGVWSRDAVLDRLRSVLGRRGRARWVEELVSRVFDRFGAAPPAPRLATLLAFLESDRPLSDRLGSWRLPPEVNLLVLPRPVMTPAPRIPQSWDLPALPTAGALAEWLEVDPSKLDWFADRYAFERRAKSEAVRHYRYRWIGKRGGAFRLLEAPKSRLKAIQRRLLTELVSHIEPHDAAHAFRRGRSVSTYVARHVGQDFVMRIDLRDFFPSVRTARVNALFRTVGYPECVARLLTGLCTNAAPQSVLDAAPGLSSIEERDHLSRTFAAPHLPQGAPTSPALANLCAWRLDCRLAGLARSAGAKYTRYADDLLFSGERRLGRRLADFRITVLAIVLDEGFEIRNRKTRVMTREQRQQAAGVVLNEHPNTPREQYEELKATLCNCVRFGPAGQNRSGHPSFRDHLRGRIAYVASINAGRGKRLHKLFDRIDWPT